MQNYKILWADDEIDLLKPHILFLEERGYHVLSTQSGDDALDILDEERVDIVFLDENKIVIELKEKFNPFTIHTSTERVRYIVEMPAGKIKWANISIGDKLYFAKDF